MLKIQINSKPDIVLSEMELTESVQNCDICINVYNVFSTDVREKTMDCPSLPNVFNVELVLPESVSTELNSERYYLFMLNYLKITIFLLAYGVYHFNKILSSPGSTFIEPLRYCEQTCPPLQN